MSPCYGENRFGKSQEVCYLAFYTYLVARTAVFIFMLQEFPVLHASTHEQHRYLVFHRNSNYEVPPTIENKDRTTWLYTGTCSRYIRIPENAVNVFRPHYVHTRLFHNHMMQLCMCFSFLLSDIQRIQCPHRAVILERHKYYGQKLRDRDMHCEHN